MRISTLPFDTISMPVCVAWMSTRRSPMRRFGFVAEPAARQSRVTSELSRGQMLPFQELSGSAFKQKSLFNEAGAHIKWGA